MGDPVPEPTPPSPDGESDYLRRAQNGDLDAFNGLVELHQRADRCGEFAVEREADGP